jgi:predicted transcriptional regulator
MTKTLTIRTEDKILEQLDTLARKQQRSRNFVANQALKDYLARQTSQPEIAAIPIAERLEDYQCRFWSEDDTDDLMSFLEAERQRSLKDELFQSKS